MTDHPQNSRPRVLSGMRPTGKLHLGNYVGALQNWVKLQDSHDCFFFVADWHALTTDYDDTSRLADNSLEVVLDFLAAGLDPEKCAIFVQSHVREHAELHLLFSMITPLGWLERVPSYKEQQLQMPNKDLHMYGFLGYPLLQAADILLYRPDFVPVGEDQVAHIELTREVARRFNSLYPLGKKWGIDKEAAKLTDEEKQYFIKLGRKIPETGLLHLFMEEPHPKYGRVDVFSEPQPLLTRTPKLLGTDKRKMSKSYGNSILLSDEAAVVEEKIRNSVTDRPKLTNHGNPDRCPVGNLHQIFSDPERQNYITSGCTGATITCVECKALAIQSVNAHLAPIRDRRRELSRNPEQLVQIIKAGAEKAVHAAEETMGAVREAVGLLTGSKLTTNALAKHLLYLKQGLLEVEPLVHLPNLPVSELVGKSHDERGTRRREIWLEAVRKNYPLRDVGHRTYVTRKNRRVIIATSGLHGRNFWKFSISDRHYDVLALICHSSEGELIDFVLPRARVVNWSSFHREDKKVEFNIRAADAQYFLESGFGEQQDITRYRANYQFLE